MVSMEHWVPHAERVRRYARGEPGVTGSNFRRVPNASSPDGVSTGTIRHGLRIERPGLPEIDVASWNASGVASRNALASGLNAGRDIADIIGEQAANASSEAKLQTMLEKRAVSLAIREHLSFQDALVRTMKAFVDETVRIATAILRPCPPAWNGETTRQAGSSQSIERKTCGRSILWRICRGTFRTQRGHLGLTATEYSGMCAFAPLPASGISLQLLGKNRFFGHSAGLLVVVF